MKWKSKSDNCYLAMALLLGFLCACNPAPKYVKPPAPTPSAFKETLPPGYKEGAGWKVAEPGDDKIRAKWWELYNDPQLNELEEQVSISNQTIAAAEANFRAARALVVSGEIRAISNPNSGPRLYELSNVRYRSFLTCTCYHYAEYFYDASRSFVHCRFLASSPEYHRGQCGLGTG